MELVPNTSVQEINLRVDKCSRNFILKIKFMFKEIKIKSYRAGLYNQIINVFS